MQIQNIKDRVFLRVMKPGLGDYVVRYSSLYPKFHHSSIVA